MNRLCDYCSSATAEIFCRADSARLCLACDRQVRFCVHPSWNKMKRSNKTTRHGGGFRGQKGHSAFWRVGGEGGNGFEGKAWTHARRDPRLREIGENSPTVYVLFWPWRIRARFGVLSAVPGFVRRTDHRPPTTDHRPPPPPPITLAYLTRTNRLIISKTIISFSVPSVSPLFSPSLDATIRCTRRTR